MQPIITEEHFGILVLVVSGVGALLCLIACIIYTFEVERRDNSKD